MLTGRVRPSSLVAFAVPSLLGLACIACGSSQSGGTADPSLNPGAGSVDLGLRVSGRELTDRCGEPVVLRGVNEMVVWSSGRDGVPEFGEIAKTGANAVRIVWTNEGTAAALDRVIANALAQQLIPIVEHHGATGNLSLVPTVVDYWTQPDVVAVLQKYGHNILLNIANEAGDRETRENFEATYRTAITRIRDTGVTMPLVVDAPQWGQDIDMLQAVGPALIEHDPEHDMLFSVHMWWRDPDGQRVIRELQESVDAGLPLMVGEFAQHAVTDCDQAPFAYDVLLAEAQRHGIGWLAWSWGSVVNGDCATEGSFDMTVRGTFGNWKEPWAEAVALSDPNSIQNTSVRPASMTGECAAAP
ncbi:MAG TPA: cellulase family glycosylhydrolase [Polyangiaceae bacterium]|nr:cellulase family glycosylhydrolase [Polyangiaceae bacterium]